jgi:hypothetical protein
MPQPEGQLRNGIAAVKAGKKEEARQLLMAVVQQNPDSEEAWLWLAAAASSPRDTLSCLKRVLAINPQNAKAAAGVRWATAQLEKDHPTTQPAPAPTAPREVQSAVTLETKVLSVTPVADAKSAIPELVGETFEPVSENSQPDADSSLKTQRTFFPNLVVGILALLLILGLVIIGFLLYQWLH